MRLALGQINTTVGDFAGNAERVIAYARQAAALGVDLVVFPELAVCGYPPEDLLLREAFVEAHDKALAQLAASVPQSLPVLVGCLERNPDQQSGGRALYNSVALLQGGRFEHVARKSLLPTYDVFDEARFFEPAGDARDNLIELSGTCIGLVICEDGWNDETFFKQRQYARDPVAELASAGARLIINLSASPWTLGKDALRQRMVAHAAKRHDVRMVYVNLVGGNVELQFDGASFAAGPEGLASEPVMFEEALTMVDTDAAWTVAPRDVEPVEAQYRALVQGIADHARKFQLPKAVIGLSGGIDSALTAALAVDALGKDNVVGIGMPSSWSSDHSKDDARQLADNLGIEYHVLSIAPLQAAFDEVLAPVFAGTEPGLAEENLQSRARGALLMAYSNKHGHLLLTTGNKSECAVGYCTLYGDTNGGLAPISDLWKTEVWALARWINRDGVRIPTNTIDKPPSAELRPDQFDTDSLPPYEELDAVLELLVESELSIAETSARTGMAHELVADLFAKVQLAEFKRYQYPPTLRVSERSWRGRRMPVSHRYRER